MAVPDPPSTREPSAPRAPAVALATAWLVLAVIGILIASVLWPVLDDRPLKMSCYWAMRGVIVPYAWLGLAAVTALLATSRDGLRAACISAAGAGLMVPMLLHVLIPVMPHNQPKQRLHDLLGLLAVGVAVLGWRWLRPPADIDEALDALAADRR